MMSLTSMLKINFYSGVFGTLLSMPFLYLAEAVKSGGESFLLHFGMIDIVMVAVAPLLAGLVFTASGLIAFPVIRILQNKGVLKDIL
jgi:hypothetical protein